MVEARTNSEEIDAGLKSSRPWRVVICLVFKLPALALL